MHGLTLAGSIVAINQSIACKHICNISINLINLQCHTCAFYLEIFLVTTALLYPYAEALFHCYKLVCGPNEPCRLCPALWVLQGHC